jgi:hypothetical protein
LNLALVALLIFTAWGPLCFNMFEAGCDAMQFYGAADMVNRGEADRLYDQARFQELQFSIGGNVLRPLHFSFYPPIVALVLSPWARLPFSDAKIVWWAVEAVGFLGVGWMIYRGGLLPSRWRTTALLSLGTLFPLWMAMRVGQLTPLWLIAILAGFFAHQRGKPMTAGFLLSILAMKPQLAVPIFLWLWMRGDRRAIAGMVLGTAVQTLAVMVFLGPGVPAYYATELPAIAKAAKASNYSAAYEQSMAGTLKNVLLDNAWIAPGYRWAAILVQPVLMLLAGVLLFRIVRINRRLLSHGALPQYAQGYEYAAAVLFVLLSTPHLLLYDVCLLAIPIVCLWNSPGWRMGVVLYLSTTIFAVFLYVLLSVSLMPMLAFWVLYRMGYQLESLEHAGAGATNSRPPARPFVTAG